MSSLNDIIMARPLEKILGGVKLPVKRQTTQPTFWQNLGNSPLAKFGGALGSMGEALLTPFAKASNAVAQTGRTIGGLAAAAAFPGKKEQVLSQLNRKLTSEQSASGRYAAPMGVLEGAGVGAQLAAYPVSAALGAAGIAARAGAKLVGAVSGGAGGLIGGIGLGLEHAGKTNAGVAEAISGTALSGITGAATGAAVGFAFGALADKFEAGRKSWQTDTGKAKVSVKDYLQTKPVMNQSVDKLIKSGVSPMELDDLTRLDVDDLTAIQTGIRNAEQNTRHPSLAASYRVNTGVGENLLKKVDAIDDFASGLSSELGRVAKSGMGRFDQAAFADNVLKRMPGDLTAFSNSDRSFMENVIDRAAQVTDDYQAHQFRQWLASEVDQFKVNFNAGKATPGTRAALNVRTDVGRYLDGVIEGYGDLRTQLAPLLEASDEFWAQAGGKWRGYEGEALSRRAEELTRRLASQASANMVRPVELMDDVLGKYNQAVGGNVAAQAHYANLIEDIYGVAPSGGFKGQIRSAIASPYEAIQALTGGPLSKVKVATDALGRAIAKPQDVAAQETRDAFKAYVDSLLNMKK